MKKVVASLSSSFGRYYLQRLNLSDIGSRLLSGALWSIVGAIVSRGLVFFSAIFIARFLGKETFGAFGILRSTINMFLVFASFGLGLTATKHVAQYKNSDPHRAGRFIVLSSICAGAAGGLIAGGLILFAPYIAATSLNAPHLSQPLTIGALALFLNALNGSQNGALTGLEAFRPLAIANFVAAVISFPGMLAFAYYGGLEGAVWGLALNAGLNWGCAHYALRKETQRLGIPIQISGVQKEIGVLWSFSIPALLSGMLFGPVNWACDAVLANQQGGFADLGIYHAALSISLAVNALNAVVGRAFLPLCVSQLESGSRKFAFFNIMLPWLTAIILVCPFIFLQELPALLFGSDFNEPQLHKTVIMVMGFTLIIAHRQGVVRNFIAGGYLWWSLWGNLLWGLLAIALSFGFRTHGAEGRALAFVGAYIVNTIIFIPLWIRWGLCDRILLVSKWCLWIWFILIFSILLVLSLELTSYFRLGLMMLVLVSVLVITRQFYTAFVNFKH